MRNITTSTTIRSINGINNTASAFVQGGDDRGMGRMVRRHHLPYLASPPAHPVASSASCRQRLQPCCQQPQGEPAQILGRLERSEELGRKRLGKQLWRTSTLKRLCGKAGTTT